MNKLIKPKNMDTILSNGIVLHSRKQYYNLLKRDLTTTCAVRSKHNLRYSSAIRIHPKYKYVYTMFDCDNIDSCKKCFLNANNYLNVLKYIKHYGQKRMD